MRRIFLLICSLIVVGVIAGLWIFLGPATAFDAPKKALYIPSHGVTEEGVLDSLDKNDIVKSKTSFKWLGNWFKYWNNIKPGKYEIKKGSNLITIMRLLKNGQQTPVNLVVNKIRTKEDLARLVGSRFECDSSQMIDFLNNADTMRKYGADTTTALWVVVPNTYTYFWNTTPSRIYQKIYAAFVKFWTEERQQKAQEHGLTPLQAYILASIIEEETNAAAEKGNIASVYINRLNNGMPLQADPTIKFAMRDFGLKRIYEKYLLTSSPYNTYRNRGLPPGPICTPSKTTIDAVLNAPKTDFLYFVADSNFNGTHVFSDSYEAHMKNAKAYQQALNRRTLATEAK